MLRRLDPQTDESLVREAIGWVNQQPLFYRDCDAVWGRETAEEYLEMMRTGPQADFGVFDGELIAVITVSLVGKDTYEGHLRAKPGGDVRLITEAAAGVMKGLFENGMKEGWMWLARKNYGVRRLVEAIGLRRDGVEMFKGQSHGQPINWLRYSVSL